MAKLLLWLIFDRSGFSVRAEIQHGICKVSSVQLGQWIVKLRKNWSVLCLLCSLLKILKDMAALNKHCNFLLCI